MKSEGAGGNATSSIKNMVSADRELDTLSRVLQGFDASADGRVSVLQLILRYTQYTHLYQCSLVGHCMDIVRVWP